MKKLANQIITYIDEIVSDNLEETGSFDIHEDKFSLTGNYIATITHNHDPFREGHEPRTFKVRIDSINISEYWEDIKGDSVLNEEKRIKLNNLLNDILCK